MKSLFIQFRIGSSVCGICGVFNFGRSTGVNESRLRLMTEKIDHRGPDDSGFYTSPDRKVGLGFRRLSILDLSGGGHQPMTNESGRYWLVFNGEIYNHLELRSELQNRGHRFKGRSDTETIVHLYEEVSANVVDHLHGIFAFAMWDELREELVLARDRIGVKPLYYIIEGGVFIFASEIKSIVEYRQTSGDVDLRAVSQYLTFMAAPAPRTMFEGIKKVEPGTRIRIDKEGHLREEKYWAPPLRKQVVTASFEECASETRRLLEESVRMRMMSDVPIGTFLSGGIDSTTNLALMAQYATGPIHTFTVGYKGSSEIDETAHARKAAGLYGSEHHEVSVGVEDMLDYVPELVYTQDEPIADPVCVPLYYVSKLARQCGVPVVQVGEGSDELFCGYPFYMPYLHEEAVFRSIRKSSSIQRGVYGMMRRVLSALGRGQGFSEMLRRRLDGQPTFWGGAVVFSGDIKKQLLSGGSLEAIQNDIEFVTRSESEAADLDFLGRMTYLELSHRLPELLLMRVDKIAMSVAVEARVPFLDHKLVEFVLSLPFDTKIKMGPKSLLKAAVHGLIPQDVIDRPKVGFPAPVYTWFSEMDRGLLTDVLLNGYATRERLVSADFVSRMVDEHVRSKRNWGVHIWVLFNLNLWFARWFEGKCPI